MALTHVPDRVGVDEAGRGPLAGPVVVAAVWLPADFDVVGIDDSKKLTRSQRAGLEVRIVASAMFSVEFADVEEVDRLNVLHATMAAMARAVSALSLPEMRPLIDGNRVPPGVSGEAVIRGDARFACIAAASILAKSARDRFMTQASKEFPEYGFERHFGYGTADHLEALRRHGPCPIHRRSFEPVRSLEQLCLTVET